MNNYSSHSSQFSYIKAKTQQNKQIFMNTNQNAQNSKKDSFIKEKQKDHYRQYRQDDQQKQSYIIKGTQSFEVKDVKNKLRIVMQKLATTKKEKQEMHKQNQNLQKQITTLRNNIRHMIPGFSNTSSNFPMSNQIVSKMMQFYKYECLDRFFENLCPQQLSMKGIIYFYHYSFSQVNEMITKYFEHTFQSIKQTGCFEDINGPIMNVLRKSYQNTFQKIFQKIKRNFNNQTFEICKHLIQKLALCSQEKEILLQIFRQFMQKTMELILMCKVSDPPLSIQLQSIGKKIKYNQIYNDPLDGFVKNTQDCWVVLPQIRKSQNGEVVVKSLVLKTDYFDIDEENQDDQNRL